MTGGWWVVRGARGWRMLTQLLVMPFALEQDLLNSWRAELEKHELAEKDSFDRTNTNPGKVWVRPGVEKYLNEAMQVYRLQLSVHHHVKMSNYCVVAACA